MADDVNPALRTELEVALASLDPQLRGLRDLAATSISGDLKAEVLRQIEIRQRRGELILKVLGFLDNAVAARANLEQDGYPEIEGSQLPNSLFKELGREKADYESAVSIFKPEGAQNLSITLGNPVAKPPKEKP